MFYVLQLSAAVRHQYTICALTDECLERLLRHDDLAVAVARQHALNSAIISKSDLFCFPRTANVYSFSVTMLTQRQFHLLNNINSVIRRVMEFGLIQKWDKDSDTLQQLRLQIEANKRAAAGHVVNAVADDADGGDEVVVLKVDHIMGALILLGCGHALALATFVAEVLLNLARTRRRWGWFARMCDAFLDSRRYFWA